MISSIFEFCQNVTIELNLLDLIIGLSTLILITLFVLVVKKVRYIIKKEREVDQRIRDTRARITRHVIEMGDYNELAELRLNIETSVEESTPTKIEEIPQESIAESVETRVIPKGKKTRAMSMEERWAEFDRKRAMRSTA